MTDPLTNITAKMLDKSIPWHNAAGWVVVLVLAWRYLLHSVLAVWYPLPPLDPLSVGDFVTLAGIPLIGFLANK